MPFKRPRSPNSTPEKSSDKSVKVDVCVKRNETVVEDCISCDWCSEWEHRSCASIQERDFELCNYENIAFFCYRCLPDVSKALSWRSLYYTYSKPDAEFEKRFQSMEDKFHKGIGHHLTKCFEAANLADLQKATKHQLKTYQQTLMTCPPLAVLLLLLSATFRWKLKVPQYL